jgi:hypothetical protein
MTKSIVAKTQAATLLSFDRERLTHMKLRLSNLLPLFSSRPIEPRGVPHSQVLFAFSNLHFTPHISCPGYSV